MPAGVLFVGVQNETSDIYLWVPDANSSKIYPLTRTPVKEGNAQWWPRNKLVLASREQANGKYGLVAIDSSLKTVWTKTDPDGSLGWAVPSPWDNRILAVRGLSNGFVETGIIDYPDGKFTPFSYKGLSGGQLAWLSPDKIMLSRVTQSGFIITNRDLNTGEEVEVVSGGQNWQSYANAEAGKFLFVRRVGQVGSIFELFKDSDGKWGYQNVTNARAYDWQPSTSRDGKTMIYRSLRNGRFKTIIRDFASAKELELAIEGFSEIYFPVILDAETTHLLAEKSFFQQN
jgi:hypothetical protein